MSKCGTKPKSVHLHLCQSTRHIEFKAESQVSGGNSTKLLNSLYDYNWFVIWLLIPNEYNEFPNYISLICVQFEIPQIHSNQSNPLNITNSNKFIQLFISLYYRVVAIFNLFDHQLLSVTIKFCEYGIQYGLYVLGIETVFFLEKMKLG